MKLVSGSLFSSGDVNGTVSRRGTWSLLKKQKQTFQGWACDLFLKQNVHCTVKENAVCGLESKPRWNRKRKTNWGASNITTIEHTAKWKKTYVSFGLPRKMDRREHRGCTATSILWILKSTVGENWSTLECKKLISSLNSPYQVES